MTKRFIGIYVGIMILFGISYITVVDNLVYSLPPRVTVSNVTLNYVLVACLAGGLTGWISWTRLFAKRTVILRILLTFIVTLIAAGIWLVLMSAGGYDIKL